MNFKGRAFRSAFSLALLAMLCAGPVSAQLTQLEGSVISSDGKTPYPDVVLIAKSTETGKELEVKSDKQGKFIFTGIRPGTYIISVKVMEREVKDLREYAMPGAANLSSPAMVKEKLREVIQLQAKVLPGHNEPIVINFKEMLAKETAEAAAKRKALEAKFAGLKAHFDAGKALLDQAIATKNEIQKTPVADRGPLTEKLTQTSMQAVTEFEAARAAAAENDSNLHTVLYNLGKSYDMAGRYDEAIDAYSKAIALKADIPAYYEPLGTALARSGKVTDAMATCEKAAALPGAAGASDAAQFTAVCYGNIGILLQNATKMKESIEPFRKATTLNPNNAEYWFLLGRGLVNAMEYKMEGGTMKTIIQPGTAEAYQKYLELAPTGRFAQDAKNGLSLLESIAPGIQTKVSTKKTKKP